jgi:hypothetical protein
LPAPALEVTGETVGRLGIDDLEDLSVARLSASGIAELLEVATEATLVFAGPDGWPMGVVVSFLHDGDRFWVTAVEGRAHTLGARRDARVSLVISSSGTSLPGRRMVAVRGTALVHAGAATKGDVLPKLAGRLAPDDPEAMLRLLDSPKRVVIEIRPVAVSASHDSRRIAGDGRGGGER